MFFPMYNLTTPSVMENYNGKHYMATYDITGKKINDTDCHVNSKQTAKDL